MKIITSHERADMDALASMYAAKLLFPDYEVLLPRKLNNNLSDLITLYRDKIPFASLSEYERRPISDLLLVDTLAIAPIRGMSSHTHIRVIDHHRLDGNISDDVDYQVALVGACTTLLVERLGDLEGKSLDTWGASLLLMGIYEDTGYLSFGTTTARDAHAVAWLLERGADLDLVRDFMHRPLTDDQRVALAELIQGVTMHTVQGRSICIASITLEHYVDELAALVHQIIDTYEPDACFLLAQYEDNVQLIARSLTDAIDVARVLGRLGGGGHSKAAAALAEQTDLDHVIETLIQLLEGQIVPPTRVSELMSTIVHTLSLDMSIRDAAHLMRRYGHEGFPVVEDDRLIGILTRRDVDRAMHHRLGDMPVRSILHTGPLHVRPTDAVDAVQRVMLDHSLGQVPVVDDGRFVGIVTRTDLMALFAPEVKLSRSVEIQELMAQTVPNALSDLLLAARQVANNLGYSLYIVGGFVRDLLLGVPNLDVDLVVEGDAIRVARKLVKVIGGHCVSHGRFGTAKVILPQPQPRGVPAVLDFVTARTEFYERPSVLPTVEQSSIKQDLYRRDFTINTMAICLDRGHYGDLLDFYGGERDLEQRRIRVLHNLSFIEDPTRILRAVRFEQRLGFTIESRTAELVDDAIELLDHVTGERLRNELYLILSEQYPQKSLDRLDHLGVLGQIHPALRFGRDKHLLFAKLRERFPAWINRVGEEKVGNGTAPHMKEIQDKREVLSANGPDIRLCYLALLVSSMATKDLESLVERLHIKGDDALLLASVTGLRQVISNLNSAVMLPSAIVAILEPFSRETRFVLSVLAESEVVRERIDLYDRELSLVKPSIDGNYLRKLGLPPGPIYHAILIQLRNALLDHQIETLEQERALVDRLVKAAHSAGGLRS